MKIQSFGRTLSTGDRELIQRYTIRVNNEQFQGITIIYNASENGNHEEDGDAPTEHKIMSVGLPSALNFVSS